MFDKHPSNHTAQQIGCCMACKYERNNLWLPTAVTVQRYTVVRFAVPCIVNQVRVNSLLQNRMQTAVNVRRLVCPLQGEKVVCKQNRHALHCAIRHETQYWATVTEPDGILIKYVLYIEKQLVPCVNVEEVRNEERSDSIEPYEIQHSRKIKTTKVPDHNL